MTCLPLPQQKQVTQQFKSIVDKSGHGYFQNDNRKSTSLHQDLFFHHKQLCIRSSTLPAGSCSFFLWKISILFIPAYPIMEPSQIHVRDARSGMTTCCKFERIGKCCIGTEKVRAMLPYVALEVLTRMLHMITTMAVIGVNEMD